MKKKVTFEESSGNIFLDLGYPPEEAALLFMRANLMIDITEAIKAKKLTQGKAAKLLGVAQPRISDLVRRKWDKFSLDMLITFAWKLGIRVSLERDAAA